MLGQFLYFSLDHCGTGSPVASIFVNLFIHLFTHSLIQVMAQHGKERDGKDELTSGQPGAIDKPLCLQTRGGAVKVSIGLYPLGSPPGCPLDVSDRCLLEKIFLTSDQA